MVLKIEKPISFLTLTVSILLIISTFRQQGFSYSPTRTLTDSECISSADNLSYYQSLELVLEKKYGLVIDIKNNAVIISGIDHSYPIDNRKVNIGDVLLDINGKSINPCQKGTAAILPSTEIPESVQLTLENQSGRFHYNLTKYKPEINEILYIDKVSGSEAYIVIKSFESYNLTEWLNQWNTVVEELARNQSIETIYFDIRGNPGGFLNTMLHSLNDLLPSNKPLFTFTSEDAQILNFSTSGSSRLQNKSIIILIDAQTGYEAALFALLAQEDNAATLIGEKTSSYLFKNSHIPTSNGTALMKVHKMVLPNGRTIPTDYQVSPDN